MLIPGSVIFVNLYVFLRSTRLLLALAVMVRGIRFHHVRGGGRPEGGGNGGGVRDVRCFCASDASLGHYLGKGDLDIYIVLSCLDFLVPFVMGPTARSPDLATSYGMGADAVWDVK